MRRNCSGFQFVELPRLPGHNGQPVLQHRVSLARKCAADNEDARFPAYRARSNTFFHARNPEPVCAGA